MRNLLQPIKKHSGLLLRLSPLVAFAVPFVWLYLIDTGSFELMWKGRTFQLFFIWLIVLELILDGKTLQTVKIRKLVSARTFAFAVSMALPTIYVTASYYANLNTAIIDWALSYQIQWSNSMPLSTEYLVFAALFCLIVGLSFGFKGLKTSFVPAFFLALVGILYTIDNVFPYGQFTPFQIFVPTATVIAAGILNLMGYGTSIGYEQSILEGNIPVLTALNLQTGALSTFKIAWPCAGIESFLIFTVVTLVFLKRMPLSWKGKVGYFVFGVVITYIINALRIVNIFLIDMGGGNIDMFHFYYGPLFAVAWITAYPLIILTSQSLWHKIKKKQKQIKEAQLALLNPA